MGLPTRGTVSIHKSLGSRKESSEAKKLRVLWVAFQAAVTPLAMLFQPGASRPWPCYLISVSSNVVLPWPCYLTWSTLSHAVPLWCLSPVGHAISTSCPCHPTWCATWLCYLSTVRPWPFYLTAEPLGHAGLGSQKSLDDSNGYNTWSKPSDGFLSRPE